MRELAEVYSLFWGDRSRLLLVVYFALPTFVVLFAVAALQKDHRDCPLAVVLLVFGGASLLVALLQGKGFRYQSLPMITATAMAWGALMEHTLRVVLMGHARLGRSRHGFVAAVLLIAAYPLGTGLMQSIRLANTFRAERAQQAEQIMQYAPNSILVLTDRVSGTFPLPNNVGAGSASPFPSIWWVGAIYGTGYAPPLGSNPTRYVRQERWLSELLVGEVVESPPDIVLVDIGRYERFGGKAFPFVEYFAEDPSFARVFALYELVGEMGQFSIWQLAVEGASETRSPARQR
jgi:hypothetical protein